MIHLSISLCFLNCIVKEIVQLFLMMLFCHKFWISNFFHRYLHSIRRPLKISASSFSSPKKLILDFKVLAILISPRYKDIRPVWIDGVVLNYTHHFRHTLERVDLDQAVLLTPQGHCPPHPILGVGFGHSTWSHIAYSWWSQSILYCIWYVQYDITYIL